MKLSKLTLSGYRCFGQEQAIQFALPATEKIGSGLTYIVGENNSGKTTVLEAFQMGKGEMIRTSDAKPLIRTEISMFDDNDVMITNLVTSEDTYTLIDQVGSPDVIKEKPIFIPARRYWQPRINNRNMRYQDIINNSSNVSLRTIENDQWGAANVEVSAILASIRENKDDYLTYIRLMKRIFPTFADFTPAREDYEFIEYRTTDGIKHKTDFLGDGIVSVMRILAFLMDECDSPLVIDEPELSLHPAAQRRLLDVLANWSSDHLRQIILSTHSLYFIDWKYIANGATLNRVAKDANSDATIHTLATFDKYSSLINGGDWTQPYLMDTIAKEIFLYDDVLFLEGQEDVGLLKREPSLNGDINLFGYGVRGWSHFEMALTLAQDLGIQKAAAILDQGEEESRCAEHLRFMFPSYKIFQWERTDIRDKPGFFPMCSNGCPDLVKVKFPKEGYFTEKGKKKPTEQLGDYQSVINEVNEYFGYAPSTTA